MRFAKPTFAFLFLTSTVLSLPSNALGQSVKPEATSVVVSSILVVDELNVGVRATVRIASDDGKSGETFVETDSDGRASPNKTCPSGKQLLAVPRVANLYLPILPVECTKNIRFSLRKTAIAFLLLKRADAEQAKGNSKVAPLIYLDVVSRLSATPNVDPALFKATQVKLYESIRAQLDTTTQFFIYDAEQQKVVLTKDGEKEVADLQVELNVKKTGQLDYKTVAKIAGHDIGGYVKAAYNAASLEDGMIK